MENKKLYLACDFKSSVDDGPGEISGYANVTGNIDRAQEIVERGAYSNLSELELCGFGSASHDWDFPIGTIEDAKEDSIGLFVRIKFHSTEKAQEIRKIILERLERGKQVGMSIGYRVIDAAYEMRDGRDVYVIKSMEVYEAAIAFVPCNPEAAVTSAKNFGLTLENHLNSVLAAVTGLKDRLLDKKSKREDEDRKKWLSDNSRESVKNLLCVLKETTTQIDSLMESDALSTNKKSNELTRIDEIDFHLMKSSFEQRTKRIGGRS